MTLSSALPLGPTTALAASLSVVLSLVGCDAGSAESTSTSAPPAAGGTTGETTESAGTTGGETGDAPPRTSGGTQTQGDPDPTRPATDTDADTDNGDTSTGSEEASESSGGNPCPRVEITVLPGETLNVRSEPSTANDVVGSLGPGHVVKVLGEAVGDTIMGTDLWYQVETPFAVGYVASPFAACTQEQVPDIDPDGFYLPIECGTSAQVIQGFNGPFSHTGINTHGIDLDLAPDTPLVAMADGEVVLIVDVTEPGDPCYNGGGQECRDAGNRVVLRHADGTLTTLLHLNRVDVALGDSVTVGTVVGLSGGTGWSSGPHLHFQRMVDCLDTDALHCQSINMTLRDFDGGSVPEEGDYVASGNCP